MNRTARVDGEPQINLWQGTVVVRIGFDGTISVEVLASESTPEDILRRRLKAAAPILEQLQDAMRTQDCELAEVTG